MVKNCRKKHLAKGVWIALFAILLSVLPQSPTRNAAFAPAPAAQPMKYTPAKEYVPAEDAFHIAPPDETYSADDIVSYVLDPSHIANDRETGIKYADDVLILLFTRDSTRQQRDAVIAAAKGEIIGRADAVGKIVLRVPVADYAALTELSERLCAMQGVANAMPDLVVTVYPQYMPNDPWTGSGTTAGTATTKWSVEAIDAAGAWDYTKNLTTLAMIGMVDQGVDTSHVELNDAVVQTLTSINVPNYDNFGHANKYTYTAKPDAHGTAVASVMAAKAENQTGFAGIAWKAKVTAFDYFSAVTRLAKIEGKSEGVVSMSVLFDALISTVMSGARAVNYSLGIMPNKADSFVPLNQEEIDAHARYVAANMSQIILSDYTKFVVVQSAGNLRQDAIHNGLFACVKLDNQGQSPEMARRILDRILIVGAAEKSGSGYGQTSFSAYGSQVSIYAPGANCLIAQPVVSGQSRYALGSGTSFAAPMVCATAALMAAVNPAVTSEEIGQILKSDAVSPKIVKNYSATILETYPMLNVKNAIAAVLPDMPVTATDEAVVIDHAQKRVLNLPARTDTDGDIAALLTTEKPIEVQNAEPFVATGDTIIFQNNASLRVPYTVVVAGDINADGRCNGTDLLLWNQYHVGALQMPPQAADAMDANRDGRVDQNDAEFIRRNGLRE
ncbi:MAG: S8 family serine peptidase [Oscillospiraceae bacterium]|nr:S8 family serine peptidase [Oscillospiraceae bacterium]